MKERSLQLTIISDTHSMQDKLGHLSGDVLIHCGDMFNMFSENDDDFERMDDWFAGQDFDLILCIGGNHDYELQKRAGYVDQPFRNAVYLEGRSYEFEGVTFFGAPWVPDLYGQAFYTEDKELAGKWADIPRNVDVLITHTPPLGVLDVSSSGLVLGCQYLRKVVEQVKPKVHCFGHVHGSSGVYDGEITTFVNAALAGRNHELVRRPYEIQLR